MPLLDAKTPIGHELPLVSRRFSVDMFAAGGARTIHNDVAAARAEGLPGPIAVAPTVASLIFRMMGLCFEEGWIAGGKSSITFRRPVGVDDFCIANGVVIAKEPESESKLRITCDVWIETEHGVKAIVGTCSGLVDSA